MHICYIAVYSTYETSRFGPACGKDFNGGTHAQETLPRGSSIVRPDDGNFMFVPDMQVGRMDMEAVGSGVCTALAL